MGPTGQGRPHFSREDHTFPGKSSSNPRKGSLRKAGEPEAPFVQPSLSPCFSSVPTPVPPPSPNSLPRAPGAKTKERITSLGAHAPRLGEEIYTTEQRAHGRGEGLGRSEAGTPRRMGRAPSQPSRRRCLQAFLTKEENHTTRGWGRGGGGGGVAVPFIHNIVNIQSLYYMCFSLVFACLSVWGLDLRSLA